MLGVWKKCTLGTKEPCFVRGRNTALVIGKRANGMKVPRRQADRLRKFVVMSMFIGVVGGAVPAHCAKPRIGDSKQLRRGPAARRVNSGEVRG